MDDDGFDGDVFPSGSVTENWSDQLTMKVKVSDGPLSLGTIPKRPLAILCNLLNSEGPSSVRLRCVEVRSSRVRFPLRASLKKLFGSQLAKEPASPLAF